MKNSFQRVHDLLNGRRPDRIPLFDLLPNDAVLQHFNGGRMVPPGDEACGCLALGEAIDATRYSYFAPMVPDTRNLPDGREQRTERWTVWTSSRIFPSSEEYESVKRKELDGWEREADSPLDLSNDQLYQRHLHLRRLLGDDFYFLLYVPSPGLMGVYLEVGIEQFSFFLADCEAVIIEQLERGTAMAERWIRSLPSDDPFETVFIGEDMAFKNGPMVHPDWLQEHYFPRLKRLVDSLHERGKKVMFHSDGNLNLVMDDLMGTGIDILNPIEVAAGMDLADLHRHYPSLIYAGGIDVSCLLPFGTPQQVNDAVVRAIEETEGKILVGSSSELMPTVPLANFIALREAVFNYNL